MVLLQVALVSDPLHKFVRPPFLYNRVHKIEKYDSKVVSNETRSISSFIQICSAVLELNHTDRQADRHYRPFCVHFMHILQRHVVQKNDSRYPSNTKLIRQHYTVVYVQFI
jgi:hypothetical protein